MMEGFMSQGEQKLGTWQAEVSAGANCDTDECSKPADFPHSLVLISVIDEMSALESRAFSAIAATAQKLQRLRKALLPCK